MAQRRMFESLMQKPAPGPMSELPREAPNRPLGEDKLGDLVDMILGGVGINDPLDPKGSSASTIGGAASMLPLGKLLQMLGRGGRAVQEAKPAINVADSMLRNHLYDELPEFAPVTHGVHPQLDPDEALKEIELTSQRRKP